MPMGNATTWKKGQSGNKNGRPRIPEDLQKFQGLCPEIIRRKWHLYSEMRVAELKALLADEDSLMGIDRQLILSVLDPAKFPFMLDRTMGKVADRIEQVNVNIDMDNDEYKEIPREALVKLVSGAE